MTYAYDDHGYLVSARQGDHSETLKVRHETLAERRAKAKDAPVGKLTGILTADNRFSYKRSGNGVVALTDQEGREASYNYDADGRLTRIDSRFSGAKAVDRSIALAYDGLDRVTSVNYGTGQIQTMTYDSWGKVVEASSCGFKASLKYDYFGRLIEKHEGKLVETYAYNAWGQRTERVTQAGTETLTENRIYDRYGRLSQLKTDKGLVQYAYNSKNQLVMQTVNGITTAYVYDAANQLVSSEEDGLLTTRYRYDAAGRLIEEGDKSYRYGWLDKVVSVSENGQVTARFGYHAGGQLATAKTGDKIESFLWDGLALIRRGETEYVNEPHAGGGAPVLAGDNVLFNDMLGSTLGAKDANGFSAVERTAFGETDGQATDEFFTGKPMVGNLGYAFLFRNYRPEQGKWQTADPLGYPDGWNQLAYCGNSPSENLDLFGAFKIIIHDLNNNSAAITSSGGLVLGGDSSAFSTNGSGFVSVNNEYVFHLYVKIDVLSTLIRNAKVLSGTTVKYLPHVSSPNDAKYAGAFYVRHTGLLMPHMRSFFMCALVGFSIAMHAQETAYTDDCCADVDEALSNLGEQKNTYLCHAVENLRGELRVLRGVCRERLSGYLCSDRPIFSLEWVGGFQGGYNTFVLTDFYMAFKGFAMVVFVLSGYRQPQPETNDTWDFEPHDTSFWDNVKNEYGPQTIAELLSLILFQGYGEPYDLWGTAVIHDYPLLLLLPFRRPQDGWRR